MAITIDRQQSAGAAAAVIMKEQIMNMTSAKLSNHHLAGVRKAPKYKIGRAHV